MWKVVMVRVCNLSTAVALATRVDYGWRFQRGMISSLGRQRKREKREGRKTSCDGWYTEEKRLKWDPGAPCSEQSELPRRSARPPRALRVDFSRPLRLVFDDKNPFKPRHKTITDTRVPITFLPAIFFFILPFSYSSRFAPLNNVYYRHNAGATVTTRHPARSHFISF